MRAEHHTKNTVELAPDRVNKYFRSGHHRRQRFEQEVEALQRLAGVAGVPAIIEADADELLLVMERLPGQAFADLDATQIAAVPDSFYLALRQLAETVIQRGIARHVMPPRDIILCPDNTPGLVDYERATLYRWWLRPIWGPACAVARFHALRFIGQHAPHLLTPAERAKLKRRMRIQRRFQAYIETRRRWRQRWRARRGKD